MLPIKNLEKLVLKYFSTDLNKIGVIKLIFLNMILIKVSLKYVFFFNQFYENKNVPKLIILNLDIKDKKLIEQTLSTKENKNISIAIAKKGAKEKVIS
ncbi:MAG: hypothetical protein Ct9H300mP5_5720 [Candidatus Pelagibacterales bacterium]|nr:MAG: hypothetical protein Ct9H300mP5_5720 [Pelagibacterales bacterium]